MAHSAPCLFMLLLSRRLIITYVEGLCKRFFCKSWQKQAFLRSFEKGGERFLFFDIFQTCWFFGNVFWLMRFLQITAHSTACVRQVLLVVVWSLLFWYRLTLIAAILLWLEKSYACCDLSFFILISTDIENSHAGLKVATLVLNTVLLSWKQSRCLDLKNNMLL